MSSPSHRFPNHAGPPIPSGELGNHTDIYRSPRITTPTTLIPARYRTIGAFDCKQYFFLVKCCRTVYNLRIVSILVIDTLPSTFGHRSIDPESSFIVPIISSRSSPNILKIQIRSISRGKRRRSTTTFFFPFSLFRVIRFQRAETLES